MRKFMTREITSTEIQSAEIVIENGVPVVHNLEPVVMLGNVSKEKAEKHLTKKFGRPVQVISVQADTKQYKLDIEKFLEVATVVGDDESSEDDEVSPSLEQQTLSA